MKTHDFDLLAIKENFAEHIAKFNDNAQGFKTLSWKKPNTVFYGIHYTIVKNVLFVHGDLDDAVYVWTNDLTFDFLAGCGLDYFASKCTASKYGRGFKSFANYILVQQVKTVIKEYNIDMKGVDWESHTDDEFEWNNFLAEYGFELFGDDFWEYGLDGKAIDSCCQYHLEGIKQAVAMRGIKE